MTGSNDATRARVIALLDEMLATSRALWARGIDPSQREDREALAILKRITERAYGEADGGTLTEQTEATDTPLS